MTDTQSTGLVKLEITSDEQLFIGEEPILPVVICGDLKGITRISIDVKTRSAMHYQLFTLLLGGQAIP